MSESLTYQEAGAAAPNQARTLFAQTMWYVAATAGLFALGAYLGRNLPGGAGIVAFIAALACLIGMQFAVRRSQQLTVGLLGAFGLLVGLAFAPVLAAYASMDLRALWQAGGAINRNHARWVEAKCLPSVTDHESCALTRAGQGPGTRGRARVFTGARGCAGRNPDASTGYSSRSEPDGMRLTQMSAFSNSG